MFIITSLSNTHPKSIDPNGVASISRSSPRTLEGNVATSSRAIFLVSVESLFAPSPSQFS